MNNMNKTVNNLTDFEIAGLIEDSEHELFFCSSGINEIIGNALLNRSKTKKVNIICNVDEDNDYNGVSKFSIIEELLNAKNVTLLDAKAKTISFISDIHSFNIIWFPVPRIFKDDTEGYNVIHIDKQLALKLITSFWELGDKMLSYVKDEAVKEAISEAEELNQLDNMSILKIDEFETPLEHKLQHIKQTLKDVPPVEPDLKRQIEVINRTLQFIDIKFEGANIQSIKLKLPKGALPFKNKKIIENIESKLKIFDDVEKYKSFKKIKEIETSINELRDQYLYKSKCKNKNLMKLKDKTYIFGEIAKLQNLLKNTVNDLIKDLNTGLSNCKKTFKGELIEFYKNNSPELPEQLNIGDDRAILSAKIDKILSYIKFPFPIDLVKNIGISHNEFDIAIEDYDNEVFLEELAKSDFLTQEEYGELFLSETAIKVKAVVNEGK